MLIKKMKKMYSVSRKRTTVSQKRKSQTSVKDALFFVDDTSEFYDPFSSLNLYLAKEIKTLWCTLGQQATWTPTLQEELVKAISPKFQQQFPQYRLSIMALKKTWEKIASLSQHLQEHPEAIAQDGKLHLPFFIRKHCKEINRARYLQHPWHTAQSIAMNICECSALLDGTWPDVEWLTTLVYMTQKNLIAFEHTKEWMPLEGEWDSTDAWIIQIILRILAKEPHLSAKEIEQEVQMMISSMEELPTFTSLESIGNSTAALLAEKLYPTCIFHTQFSTEQKKAMHQFLRSHVALCRGTNPNLRLSEIVRRMISLYLLASALPAEISKTAFQQAVLAGGAHAQQEPPLPQLIHAFIAAELLLFANDTHSSTPDVVAEEIWKIYKEASLLPQLQPNEMQLLEIVLWKILNETEKILAQLPYAIGKRVEEELGHLMIDNPHLSFSSLAHLTMQSFQRTKELLSSQKHIDKKISLWAMQSDLLCRWIHIDRNAPLLKRIVEKGAHSSLSHEQFVYDICYEYIRDYPELLPYVHQLHIRTIILYKHAWYTFFAASNESAFTRFLKWHARSFLACSTLEQPAEVPDCQEKLRDLVERMLPLIPFDEHQA